MFAKETTLTKSPNDVDEAAIDGCMALNNKKTSYRLSCIVSCNEKTDMLNALNNARSSMI